jgi:carboxypeptidase family protein
MSRKLRFAILLALALAFATGVSAQKPKKDTATFTGTVFGADGKPVPAASITCQSSAGIHPRIVHTDARGHYLITGLRQDNYDLRASAKGAYSDWEKNVFIHKGETKTFTFHLLNGNTAISGILPKKQTN